MRHTQAGTRYDLAKVRGAPVRVLSHDPEVGHEGQTRISIHSRGGIAKSEMTCGPCPCDLYIARLRSGAMRSSHGQSCGIWFRRESGMHSGLRVGLHRLRGGLWRNSASLYPQGM